ncbi:MAG: hypothetical protein QM751_06290 [Paludibacteraceae bacterium]
MRIISFRIIKYAVNIASVFLITLFVYQQMNDSKKTSNIAEKNVKNTEYKNEKIKNCNLTASYAQQHPKEVLICYLKETKRKTTIYEQIKKDLNK